jgi:hypothetical protein
VIFDLSGRVALDPWLFKHPKVLLIKFWRVQSIYKRSLVLYYLTRLRLFFNIVEKCLSIAMWGFWVCKSKLCGWCEMNKTFFSLSATKNESMQHFIILLTFLFLSCTECFIVDNYVVTPPSIKEPWYFGRRSVISYFVYKKRLFPE